MQVYIWWYIIPIILFSLVLLSCLSESWRHKWGLIDDEDYKFSIIMVLFPVINWIVLIGLSCYYIESHNDINRTKL